jgi:hypothetical protein
MVSQNFIDLQEESIASVLQRKGQEASTHAGSRVLHKLKKKLPSSSETSANFY